MKYLLYLFISITTIDIQPQQDLIVVTDPYEDLRYIEEDEIIVIDFEEPEKPTYQRRKSYQNKEYSFFYDECM